MIVRISGEGQFSVDDAATADLNRLDSELEDTLEPSDLILPPQDASMDEVRSMLTEEGLIPG